MDALGRGLERHRLSVVALASLAVLDLLTTTLGLARATGLVREQNPLGLAAWSLGGLLGLLVYKALFFLPVIGTLFLDGRDPDDRYVHRLVGAALLGGVLFSTWLVARNVAVLVDVRARWLP